MLARCGAAGCILVLIATSVFARVTVGSEAAHTVLIAGAYVLLGLSGLMFLAGEAMHGMRKPRLIDAFRRKLRQRMSEPVTPSVPDKSQPVPAVDDLVGLLGNTLKLADPVPAGQLEAIDVADLLNDVAGRQKGAQLSLRAHPRSLHTRASRPALTRALEILVENAVSNSPRVAISCDRGLSALVVHVDDDGPGIPASERQRIFEWQTYMSTPGSSNTSCRVELVIARQILRAQGGDVGVGPSPLGGARFTARMPLLAELETELAVAS